MCYVNRLKRDALEAWRHDMLIWAAVATQSTKKISAPAVPDILRPNHAH